MNLCTKLYLPLALSINTPMLLHWIIFMYEIFSVNIHMYTHVICTCCFKMNSWNVKIEAICILKGQKWVSIILVHVLYTNIYTLVLCTNIYTSIANSHVLCYVLQKIWRSEKKCWQSSKISRESQTCTMLIIPFSDTRWVLAYLYPLISVSESELSDTQVLITWEFLNELGLL